MSLPRPLRPEIFVETIEKFRSMAAMRRKNSPGVKHVEDPFPTGGMSRLPPRQAALPAF
jgi:hypothetical protein